MEIDNKRRARFAFIEALLLEHGHVRRAYLHRAYGINMSQVSRILTDFRAAAPEAAEFDASTKTWLLRPGYQPKYLTIAPSEYIDAMITVSCEPIFDLALESHNQDRLPGGISIEADLDTAFDSYEECRDRLTPDERRAIFRSLVTTTVRNALRGTITKLFRRK